MEVSAGLDLPHGPDVVFPWVADLGRYPSWLEIVRRAEPEPDGDEGEGPAWKVELRARLGPMARSKRLRMVRAAMEPDRSARFERAELDGREHSDWVLAVALDPAAGGCHLRMTLTYAGSALAPLVQRILADEIDRSGRRLLGCLDAEAGEAGEGGGSGAGRP
ncbi:MAG: SRPBCC family protein [Acidimicrobiia bacterium]